MKLYLKHFRIFFIILIVCAVITACFVGYRRKNPPVENVRGNTECLQQNRVFDYGELLTEEEEAELEALIAQRQDECACDIVLVTLKEPVDDQWNGLRDWADDFYDQNLFGYDMAHGDGALLVDNWYSFGDYNGDTWLSTSGRVESSYSSQDIDELLDDVCERVNDNPYEAYRLYVNELAGHMNGGIRNARLPLAAVIILSLLIAIGYFLYHFYAKPAKDTTTPLTYVTSGQPVQESREDRFLHKSVHKHRIETDSGGGGGGHHISSGGFSHGGGGHHH